MGPTVNTSKLRQLFCVVNHRPVVVFRRQANQINEWEIKWVKMCLKWIQLNLCYPNFCTHSRKWCFLIFRHNFFLCTVDCPLLKFFSTIRSRDVLCCGFVPIIYHYIVSSTNICESFILNHWKSVFV